MPGTHSPISRHFFTLNGNVLTSGGAKNLAKGQFTIVDSEKAGANGAVVVTNFAGMPDSTVYAMRLGKSPLPKNRTVYDSKPYSSQLFTIKDLVSVKGNFPQVTEQQFDELLIGYDGLNANTAITLEEGMSVPFDLELYGDHISYQSGGEKCYLVKIHFGKEKGETNQDMVRRAVERLKQQTLPGGVPITEMVDITTVDSSNPPLAGTSYTFSDLAVVDEGDSNALAIVQAQYPQYKVVVKMRSGLTTIYSILHPTASSLPAFNKVVSSAYIKNCADCAAGYTELAGGFVYSVTIEDDGIDLTTTVDDLPGFVTGTAIRQGVRDGRGLYTIVTDDALTQAEIAAYVATAGVKTTATIELLGEVKDVCSDVDTITIAWTNVEVCYAQADSYNLQLKDNDCGESRLTELRAYYPELTIVEGKAAGNGSQTVTLTGTSGTANINVGGVNYLATFATSLTQTATNFVTANAAAILTATGLVVTANTGVLTFAGNADFLPVSIANATTNLAGTVSSITYTTVATVGGCQRVYSTQVITNVVCEECSDEFIGQFTSVPPSDFDFTSWELAKGAANTTALMGIRIKGKPFIMYPGEAMRDMVPFYETSTRLSVSAGYVTEENESFEPINRNIFNVKRLSRAQDRDNLGGHLMQWESVSQAYFDGTRRHKELFAKAVFGQESVLEFDKQYVSAEITVQDCKYSQSVGSRSDIGITYIVVAELGREAAMIAYINKLAARAGLAAIKPTAVV